VLGIINKPGCFAQYITLPVANLHVVPTSLSDAEAAFCEPLAAACRILEQGLLETQQGSTQQVAVVGECYCCCVMLPCTWLHV
jgi:threonine dehydrogenase-like Zn-dependent dehydrogenase